MSRLGDRLEKDSCLMKSDSEYCYSSSAIKNHEDELLMTFSRITVYRINHLSLAFIIYSNVTSRVAIVYKILTG